MNLADFLFWVAAALTGLSAIMVVVTQHIVRAAAWLLFTLAGVAGVFFLLGADFIGAAQLIVYVGGTLVLVVFGVMLTAQGPFVNLRTGAGEWAIALIVGVALYATLMVSALSTAYGFPETPTNLDTANAASTTELGQVFLGLHDANPLKPVTGYPAGTKVTPDRSRASYLLPFEIVSVHLLVVLVGAAYLARAKRRAGAIAS
jgi:NADH-quinone oxidoreductase subunit J